MSWLVGGIQWVINGITGALVSGMSSIVCAVIFWALSWIWPWAEYMLGYLPAWLPQWAVTVLDPIVDLWKIANVFLPLQEFFPFLFGYWTFLLAFRCFALANSMRKL